MTKVRSNLASLASVAIWVVLAGFLAGGADVAYAKGKGKRHGKKPAGEVVLPAPPILDSGGATIGPDGASIISVSPGVGGLAPLPSSGDSNFIGPPSPATVVTPLVAPSGLPPPPPIPTDTSSTSIPGVTPPSSTADVAPPNPPAPPVQLPRRELPAATPSPPPFVVTTTAEETSTPVSLRPRRRIMDYPTTFLIYTGGAFMLAGVVGLLSSGALQVTDGTPGGTCNFRGQTLTGSDCVTNNTSLFQIGYGVSGGALGIGSALLAGGVYRYYRRPPQGPPK